LEKKLKTRGEQFITWYTEKAKFTNFLVTLWPAGVLSVLLSETVTRRGLPWRFGTTRPQVRRPPRRWLVGEMQVRDFWAWATGFFRYTGEQTSILFPCSNKSDPDW
jgi:hypothetical protein